MARTSPQKTGKLPSLRLASARGVRSARIAANEYCLLTYGTSFIGGVPYRLALASKDVWIVPALFTSPGYGNVGEVGMIAVDALTMKVIASTPREEARTRANQLAQEKRDELDAAFRRSRKA